VTVDASDVSVVMTVRNGDRYLAEALDSVVHHRPTPGQIVVVNDGSRDGTAEVLAAYGELLHVIHQEPQGFARGLNRGVAAATQEFLAFLDADDVWTPDALGLRRSRMAAGDEPDAVFGQVVQFVSPDLSPDAARRFRFDPGPSHARLFGAMLIGRDAFLRVGMLDESLPSAAAIDWISRAQIAEQRFVTIDDVVLQRRLHRTNVGVTSTNRETMQALHDVVRAHHERRHGSSAPVDY
jgi:glycosyltransferase involved in cell wall biosynthesis